MAYDYFSPDGNAGRDTEPRIESDTYTDLIYDRNDKGHPATITYDYYYYQGACHITSLSVKTKLIDKYLLESILENISLREGKRVELETKLELI